MICVSSFLSLFSSSILRSSSGAKVGGIARVITIDDFLFLIIAFLSAFSPSSYPKELLLLFCTIGVIAQHRSIFDARKRFALFSSTLRVDIIRAFETTLDGAVASDVAKVPEEGEKDVAASPQFQRFELDWEHAREIDSLQEHSVDNIGGKAASRSRDLCCDSGTQADENSEAKIR